MKIFLTGFMGSGKTTYGKELAEVLGYDFLDMDEAIEKKAGKKVAEIFEADGEEKFRTIESEALRETNSLAENSVIATGGGTPCFNDNMEWMNANGKTVYLKLFESELLKRLVKVLEDRPLLKDQDADSLPGFIYNTLRERAFFYHQAQVVIHPAEFGPEELAEMLR